MGGRGDEAGRREGMDGAGPSSTSSHGGGGGEGGGAVAVPRSPGRGGARVEEVDGNWYPVTRRRYIKKKWAGPQALRRRMMTQQKRELKKTLRPGEVIHKLHRSYDLMLNLQLGIRWSVGMAEAVGGGEGAPTAEDYDRRLKQVFPSAGSEETPPHPSRDFQWKDYSPAVFRKLRASFGEDAGEYMVSVTGSQALRQMGSPGKSGSVFFMSQDDRYIIKTMRKDEQKKLQAMLQDYYDHVHNFPHTLLTRFCGMHKVKPEREGRDVRFVVMHNAFCTDLEIHETYDLKGSTLGRVSTRKERASLRYVRKDLDYQGVKHMRAAWQSSMLEQLEADVAFLARHNIMDYSLLLGVHYADPPPFRPPQLPPPTSSLGLAACCGAPRKTHAPDKARARKYAASVEDEADASHKVVGSRSDAEAEAESAAKSKATSEAKSEAEAKVEIKVSAEDDKAHDGLADGNHVHLAHRRAMSWDFKEEGGALSMGPASPMDQGAHGGEGAAAGDSAGQGSFVLKEWDAKDRASPRGPPPSRGSGLKVKVTRCEAPLPAIPDVADDDDDDEVRHRRSQSAGNVLGGGSLEDHRLIDLGWREQELFSGGGRDWDSDRAYSESTRADGIEGQGGGDPGGVMHAPAAPIFGHDMPAAMINRGAPGTYLHRDADPVLLKSEGHDEWGRPEKEQVYLFFSVIDILQDFNYSKSMEHIISKIARMDWDSTMSSVPPDVYAKRFINYVRTNFLGVDDAESEPASPISGVSREALAAAQSRQS